MMSVITATAMQYTWSISKMLAATQKTAMNYVKIITMIVGIVMVGVGIYQIAKNLISHGKGQTNWVITFALLIVGGTLAMISGWTTVKNAVTGGKNTLDNMGKGSSDEDAKPTAGNVTDFTAIIGGDVVAFD